MVCVKPNDLTDICTLLFKIKISNCRLETLNGDFRLLVIVAYEIDRCRVSPGPASLLIFSSISENGFYMYG